MSQGSNPKVTVSTIRKMKRDGVKIVALTAYDATFAQLEDEAGVDVILVGDSLGMVIQGFETTLPVTIDDVIYHTRAASRGIQRAMLVSDMPFMSYQVSSDEALRNAGRCIKEGGADAVKMEGGEEICETIHRMVGCGIPVMAHVGMQPQKVRSYGGFTLQGRRASQAEKIMRDALAVEQAGAFSVVIEKTTRSLAADITTKLKIPTIGIASGVDCDGQILVNFDLLGLSDKYRFKFVRRYLELASDIREAVSQWGNDIREGSFPNEEESFE